MHASLLFHVQDCFELGVILLRKKLYTQATKNLEKAARMWEGEPEELAQVGWGAPPAVPVWYPPFGPEPVL